jgi:hypothetical protein
LFCLLSLSGQLHFSENEVRVGSQLLRSLERSQSVIVVFPVEIVFAQLQIGLRIVRVLVKSGLGFDVEQPGFPAGFGMEAVGLLQIA